MGSRWLLGVDFGSTALKAVLADADTSAVAWQRYERHESLIGEKLLEWLRALERDFGMAPANCRVFATGAAAGDLAPAIGARAVQEVHAISLVVEQRHPAAQTVIELGGQDAKIVLFKDDGAGRRKKLPSMNDKCAGGTGAVIDKIAAKVGVPPGRIHEQTYEGIRIHPIAGKCGVFAETDITGLLKQGIPARELMASLFDAIVLQNLSVLTRGYTMLPDVVLLGGPNAFIAGLREAWRLRISEMWRDRGVPLPPEATPEELVAAPPMAEYYAALGAIEFGRLEPADVGRYLGADRLRSAVGGAREEGRRSSSALPGLVASERDRDDFIERYAPPPFAQHRFAPGARVRAFLGLDAGSTSTKGVLLAEDGALLAKAYRLSLGNPIEDAMDIIARLRGQIEGSGARVEIAGVGTTGYAKDILRDVLGADVAIAETVAHTEAAKREYPDPHVIVDVGGQDIKLIFLKDGRVKDFRLNTQCSAGNGYFLQATAESFGVAVERYADAAFAARAMPRFGYGCAVFLQSDIVAFQRQGWTREEILAGLAAVLPKNVFLYVARVPNLARLGTRFILQGGTQRNLAAVKAEVDFIRAAFAHADREPDIVVHKYAGEAGGIGAALEAMRVVAARDDRATTFIGLDAVVRITYRTTRGEETRCRFCTNDCLRTFIDVSTGEGRDRRVIVATCEKGAVEEVGALRAVKAGLDRVAAANPNFVDIAGREVWHPQHPARVVEGGSRASLGRVRRLRDRRASIRVGVPRVLNMYGYAPLFSAYLESLGVAPGHIVYSDFTSPELYRSGSSRGSIDPCYPSKVAIAHVQNLLAVKHRRTPLDCIFFPMFDVLDSPLVATRGQNACPTVAATPRTVRAAFTKESDAFAAAGVAYLDPLVNLADRRLFALQMFETWAPIICVSRAENRMAVDAGFVALETFWRRLRDRAREALDRIEREDRLGIVVLGRPYHHDPGVNHGILEELQKRGYPVFPLQVLPRDEDLLERLFGEEVRQGLIAHPLDISDVWQHTTSENTNQKIWGAKFVARHPHLVALEFSSFKCGHDAPVYTLVEEIIEAAGRPYLAFKDLDENRAAGAVRLRVETIDYFLKRYREDSVGAWVSARQIEEQLAAYERDLRLRIAHGSSAPELSPIAAA